MLDNAILDGRIESEVGISVTAKSSGQTRKVNQGLIGLDSLGFQYSQAQPRCHLSQNSAVLICHPEESRTTQAFSIPTSNALTPAKPESVRHIRASDVRHVVIESLTGSHRWGDSLNLYHGQVLETQEREAKLDSLSAKVWRVSAAPERIQRVKATQC
jgi:hypothetical protein